MTFSHLTPLFARPESFNTDIIGEFQGTLCPYPGLIEEFVNSLLPADTSLRLVTSDRRPMVKQENGCFIKLS